MTLLNTAFTWFSEQGYCFRTGLRGWLEVSSPLGWLPSAPQAVKENLSVITQPLTEHLVSARLRDTEQEERERETCRYGAAHSRRGLRMEDAEMDCKFPSSACCENFNKDL